MHTSHFNIDEINFTTFWSPISSFTDLEFAVAVTLSTIHGDTLWTATELPTVLILRNNTLYTVNISICPDLTTHFIIGNIILILCLNSIVIGLLHTGRCPFLWNSLTPSVLYYNISVNGSMTALLNCTADCQQCVAECGMDGQWNIDVTDICSTTSLNVRNFYIGE